MSKLNSEKINFNKNNFLVEVSQNTINNKQNTAIEKAQNELENTIEQAKIEAKEIIEQAKIEAQTQAQNIKDNAQIEADKIIQEAQEKSEEILKEAQEKKEELLSDCEKQVEKASQEGALKGYDEGYQDAQNKFFEENEERINSFDEFCSKQSIVKDKILKNASREIINIIQNISHSILLKEVDGETLDKIIKNTISLFDKKENITIIVSEKYARLLFELQQKELDKELNFEEFKQYKNFDILYNKELKEDTIIVENLKERFCASIEEQFNKIMREILDNTQNGNIDVEEYDETKQPE